MDLGISPRRFDGWEPTERTRFIYDDEGRLSEMITTRDPEWDMTDRAIMMGVKDLHSDLHTCGQPLSESLRYAPGTEPEGYVKPDYEAKTYFCLACEEVARIQDAWARDDEEKSKKNQPAYPSARLVAVERINSHTSSPTTLEDQ